MPAPVYLSVVFTTWTSTSDNGIVLPERPPAKSVLTTLTTNGPDELIFKCFSFI